VAVDLRDLGSAVELGVVIGKRGRDISESQADSYVAGYGLLLWRGMTPRNTYAFFLALAIDMTARNIQDQVKKKGLPWSAAKGFDTFTPVRQA